MPEFLYFLIWLAAIVLVIWVIVTVVKALTRGR